jgi:hypothetical protein
MAQIEAVLTYTFFHNNIELPSCNVSILKRFSKNAVLKFFISLNLAIQETNDSGITHLFIKNILQMLPDSYREKAKGFVQRHRFSSKPVIDEILVDIINSKEFGNDGLDKLFVISAFDIVLIYNEYRYSPLGLGIKSDSLELIWKMHIYQGLNAEKQHAYARTGTVKQLTFIGFLKNHLNDYITFEQKLLRYTGLRSLYDNTLIFTSLIVSYQKAIKTDVPNVHIPPDHDLYKILHDIDVVIDYNSEIVDISSITTKPFIKLIDKSLYLTGTSNFSLITDKSWFYYLFKNNIFPKSLKINSYGDVQSYIGKKYVEEYLMKNLLGSIKKVGVRHLYDEKENLPDVSIILNERDVFLFEIKSSSLVKNVTIEKSVDQFKVFIDKNFVKGKKGVPQLNRYIKHLAENSCSDYNLTTDLNKLRIFPIIIYTEPHLNANGVNEYIIKNSPQIDNEIKSKFQKVEPITMVHYDFFIENLREFRLDRNLLKNCIQNYHHKLRMLKKKYTKSQNVEDYYKSLMSFSSFAGQQNNLYNESHVSILDEMDKIFNFRKDAANAGSII